MSNGSKTGPTKDDSEGDDCLECRLVSGVGLCGIGSWIYLQAKKNPPGLGRNLIHLMSAGNRSMN